MDATMLYFLKSSGLLAAFFAAYHLLLRNETFFVANRWYLLAGLITSAMLPLITFTTIVWTDPAPIRMYNQYPMASAIINNEAPKITDWPMVLTYVYCLGAGVCLMKLFADFISLRRLLAGKFAQYDGNFKFVDISERISPFSFFNTIVYNSAMYSAVELSNILEHEKIHSRQQHSMDVLIARLFCIIFWFNPIVWLYKKAIFQNLEFIADSEAVKSLSDIKSYQFTLLKITTHQSCVAITNHFFQSLIKKRIVMLNKNQSKTSNSWKYALILPVLAAFLMVFQSEVIAKEKPRAHVAPMPQNAVEVVVEKNTSDAQLKSDENRLKKEHNIALKFSKIKRNGHGEIIAIKAEYKDNSGKKGTTQISGSEPIAPIRFYKNASGIGFGRSGEIARHKAIEIDRNEYLSHLKSSSDTIGGDHKIIIHKNKDGKGAIVTMNGEVIVDTEKILAEIDPLTIDGINIISGDSDVNRIDIDTREMTRDAMRIAEQAMKRARIEMERARPELDRAKRNLDRDIPDDERLNFQQSKRELEQANRELQQAKREIEQSRREMEQARRELEQSRRELQAQKRK